MDDPPFTLDIEGRLALVRLNRPAARNALFGSSSFWV